MQIQNQKVKEYFNETENYLKNNPEIDLRSKLIKKILADPKNNTILDIGCGNGDITLPYIKNNKITFVDLSDKMLQIVRTKIPADYHQNAEFLNVSLDKFDNPRKYGVVFMIGVLAHVSSIESAFSKLKELVETDGTLIIQFTNSRNIISFLMRFIFRLKKLFGRGREYKINYTSLQDIRRELEKNNLDYSRRVVYWPTLPGFSVLPPAIRNFIYYKLLNSRLLRPLGGETLLVISLVKD